MKGLLALLALTAAFISLPDLAAAASTDCLTGAYRSTAGAALAIVHATDGSAELRFMTSLGRTGTLRPQSADVLAIESRGEKGVLRGGCYGEALRMTLGAQTDTWRRLPLVRRYVQFESDGAMLAGELVRAAGVRGPLPLLVFTHGSEATKAIDSTSLPFLLAANGVEVFIYDKRGTGASGGRYTQDFVSLGEDAAHALTEARRDAGDEIGRVGVFGASQGGWIAPYAAKSAHADFVVVGYGVVGTPLEQDIWQVNYELAHLTPAARSAQIAVDDVTATTARIAASDFRDHLSDLARLRSSYGAAPWFSRIEGQYTGELLRGEIDRARRESPEVIWNYDALSVMRALTVPQLWIMAQEDSVAPSAPSLQRLRDLRATGKAIDIAIFPETDHGIRTFRVESDGKRVFTGVAPGYVTLISDWVKGTLRTRYGAARLEVTRP